MRFEISERIPTQASKEDILKFAEEKFRKIADSVERSGDTLIVKSIEASFGSINRKDSTEVHVEIYEKAVLCVADVNYRPSGCFWAIFVLLLFTWVAWLIPIGFYFYQKKSVQEAIREVFSRVRDEFQTAKPSISTPVSAIEQVEKLAALKEKGHITEQEFSAKKKELLGL